MTERASDDILVNAPPDLIMGIITDYESYPQWSSNIKDVEVRQSDGQGRATQVWYHVDARVMDVNYTLAYEYPDEHRLTWSLVEGEQLRQLDGEYLLSPEGDATRVHYSLEVDTTLPLPGFLKKRAQKQIMETGLDELKRRAEATG